ncbi:MAG: hypothetical protein AAF654_12280 [Myxococcota bacterium]
MRRLHRLTVLAAFALGACGSDDEPTPTAEIDDFLTSQDLVGGPFSVIVALENCGGTPAARLLSGGQVLASVPAIEPLTVLQEDDGGAFAETDDRPRFVLTIEAEQLDPAVYGLPVRLELEAEVDCPNGTARSAPYAIRYVPTDDALQPPIRPVRFWPAETTGDLLICEDTELVNYVGGITETSRLNLGFPCSLLELDGQLGERRYAWGSRFGLAAISPAANGGSPALAWTRSVLMEALWTDDSRDPVTLRSEAGSTNIKGLYVVDFETGADLFGPVFPATGRVFLDAVTRTASGDVLVLEAERIDDPPSLTYFVRRFDGALADLGTTQVVRYDYAASSDRAPFSFDGDTLFFKDAPVDAETARIGAFDTETLNVRFLTTFDDPWRFPLGDAFGRLLVASESGFRWLDPASGAALSEPFAPTSGRSFLRLRVEPDGSLVMLADATNNAAQGLYIFRPDGSTLMQFTSSQASFGWLATGWNDTSLISYFNEVHALPTRSEYDARAASSP